MQSLSINDKCAAAPAGSCLRGRPRVIFLITRGERPKIEGGEKGNSVSRTVRSPIFTAVWHWGARILRNFDLLTRARARAVHNMFPATAPCARAPGGAMRALGSQCIFTVLAISAMRGPQNGWLAASYFSELIHAFRAACMHSGLPACM